MLVRDQLLEPRVHSLQALQLRHLAPLEPSELAPPHAQHVRRYAELLGCRRRPIARDSSTIRTIGSSVNCFFMKTSVRHGVNLTAGRKTGALQLGEGAKGVDGNCITKACWA
jgi:hypothetical protein